MIDQSLWRSSPAPRFRGPLPTDVDVVIVGGGITGLTAAYLLKRSGKRVLVVERERIGSGETGNTSAHLTYVTDARITELASRFGDDAARRVWAGGALALDLIEEHAADGMTCGFRRVPGYLCAPFLDEEFSTESLEEDAGTATKLGFDARLLTNGPITGRPAAAFADQAVFHPLDYLVALATAIDGDGSAVRDEAEVGAVIDDPLAVIVNGENIACGDLIIATHVPIVGNRGLVGATLFQTKLYGYSSYVMSGRVADDHEAGLYSDTANPYYYLRVHDDSSGRYAIFGGNDHKTGQADSSELRFERLADAFKLVAPSVEIERRWSGQVIETDDGLPFIGEVAPHQYVATGFGGNGLTFGTLGGLMMHDAIVGHPNPWQHLFDPHRKARSADAIKRLLEENVDYAYYYLADRVRRRDKSGVENVARGTGKIISIDGQRVAVHRRDNGDVVKVSAACTHMGCLVRWNDAERTWDCPCHGSRFTPDGLVLTGPAEAPLAKVES